MEQKTKFKTKRTSLKVKKNYAMIKERLSDLHLDLFGVGTIDRFNKNVLKTLKRKRSQVKDKIVSENHKDSLGESFNNSTIKGCMGDESEPDEADEIFPDKKVKTELDGNSDDALLKSEQESDYDSESELPFTEETNKNKSAWQDEDDTNIKIKDAFTNKNTNHDIISQCGQASFASLLKQKLAASLGETPSWASLDVARQRDQLKEAEEEDDEDVLKLGINLVSQEGGAFPKNFVSYRWLPDVNLDDEDVKAGQKIGGLNCHLKTVFAKHLPLALVTRSVQRSGVASLFHVTAEKCSNMDHLRFNNFKITSSTFLPNENKFMLGSDFSKDFYLYDMEASKEIRVPWRKEGGKARQMRGMAVLNDNELIVHEESKLTLIDLRTYRPSAILKAPSSPETFCVSQHGDTIYTHGLSDGKVRVWDVNSRQIRTTFLNEGCIQNTSLAISPNSKYLACGSGSGIVNVYDNNDIERGFTNLKPVKELGQLTTAVNNLEFNHSSEALMMCSSNLDDAIKMVHFPSMKAFSNFPVIGQGRNRLGKILSCKFSPNSAYLSFSTIHGRVRRIRLEYYSNY